MTKLMPGGCQCGRIRYQASVNGKNAYFCHCRMCQRATGGIAASLIGLKKIDVHWETEPDWYASSVIARRAYCRDCGTPLGFAYNESEHMDLTVGSFDDPYHFKPSSHFGVESRHNDWVPADGLPEHRARDYAPLNARWAKAEVEPPK
ncbi:MAG: GFA family protein [Pseudomonadota bacterium]